MTTLHVAGLQPDIVWEQPTQNLDKVAEMATMAAAAGAELVVAPEMFATGFTMDAELAAAAAEETVDALGSLARKLSVWVLAGLVEITQGAHSNNALLFDPSGAIRLRQRKLHPFTLVGEERWCTPGDTLSTVSIGDLRITVVVCYDLRFPELFRPAARDTDLFVVPANWPKSRREPWLALLRARAIDCQAYVLGVNRVGADGNDVQHSGDSAVFDPLGRTVTSLAEQEGWILAKVDTETVRSIRKRYPFLSDRRPALYRSLADHRSRR